MNNLQIKVKTALMSRGLNLGDLANEMKVSVGNLSRCLKADMKMTTALLINDSLFVLTGQTLTLEDFRKDLENV